MNETHQRSLELFKAVWAATTLYPKFSVFSADGINYFCSEQKKHFFGSAKIYQSKNSRKSAILQKSHFFLLKSVLLCTTDSVSYTCNTYNVLINFGRSQAHHIQSYSSLLPLLLVTKVFEKMKLLTVICLLHLISFFSQALIIIRLYFLKSFFNLRNNFYVVFILSSG